jgi:hypothetical protein
MKVGITGSPQSGKTTLYRLLTGSRPGSGVSGAGVMEIPDDRVLTLSKIFEPSKTTYARIDLVDIQHQKGQKLLNEIRNLDALIVVIGSFMGEPGVRDSIDFLDSLRTEFYVADLSSVENRLEKLHSHKAKPVSQMEVPFLEKCKERLDQELSLKGVEFSAHETDFLRNFAFYTLKPMILALNLSEEHLLSKAYPGIEEIRHLADTLDYEMTLFSGAVEEEILSLPAEDMYLFLKEYGLEEPGTSRVAKVTYSALGLISFFTVGSDEVRAWSIPLGSTVKEAAGKIHSDLERGFIRAEVVPYEQFISLGSLKACRDKGILRVEGKDYIVQDGDIVNVRFNV